jgi:hypothetical protein
MVGSISAEFPRRLSCGSLGWPKYQRLMDEFSDWIKARGRPNIESEKYHLNSRGGGRILFQTKWNIWALPINP